MADDQAIALSKSIVRFQNLIIPILKQNPRWNGEFICLENCQSNEAKILDYNAGFDILHISSLGVMAIASRIQEGNYNTFTIRNKRISGAKTEFEKRKYAIKNGYLYPNLTLQAYISKQNKLNSFAYAKTIDLIEMIEKGYCYEDKTGSDQIGQAIFYVIDWLQMQNLGYSIFIYPEQAEPIQIPEQKIVWKSEDLFDMEFSLEGG